jgi:predicted nucleic acid-binding protein
MAGRIEPMFAIDVEVAGALAHNLAGLSARDLVHLAVIRRLGVTRIVSSDKGFDGVPDVERLDPARFEEWRDSVTS